MTTTAHRTRFALLAVTAAAMLPACTTSTPGTSATIPTAGTTTAVAAPTQATVTVAAPPSPAAPPVTSPAECALNPATAPVPTAEPFASVPEADRVSVALHGFPSATLTPGAAPVEFDVTVCNDSPVAYPSAGVVVVLEHCSCSPAPTQIAVGTVERLDPTTGDWIAVAHPAAGMGMDYLGQFTDIGGLAKGQAVTLRYRVALDASMTAGDGGLEATVVTADGTLNSLGSARLPFAVA
ncbi:hypothetical protein [Mycolicibacterium sp.]|uniref:hypothetical protein n=1 Tax=Mycolicibacterium sp. TaxID=2320850 RepID=UPI003D138124